MYSLKPRTPSPTTEYPPTPRNTAENSPTGNTYFANQPDDYQPTSVAENLNGESNNNNALTMKRMYLQDGPVVSNNSNHIDQEIVNKRDDSEEIEKGKRYWPELSNSIKKLSLRGGKVVERQHSSSDSGSDSSSDSGSDSGSDSDSDSDCGSDCDSDSESDIDSDTGTIWLSDSDEEEDEGHDEMEEEDNDETPKLDLRGGLNKKTTELDVKENVVEWWINLPIHENEQSGDNTQHDGEEHDNNNETSSIDNENNENSYTTDQDPSRELLLGHDWVIIHNDKLCRRPLCKAIRRLRRLIMDIEENDDIHLHNTYPIHNELARSHGNCYCLDCLVEDDLDILNEQQQPDDQEGGEDSTEVVSASTQTEEESNEVQDTEGNASPVTPKLRLRGGKSGSRHRRSKKRSGTIIHKRVRSESPEIDGDEFLKYLCNPCTCHIKKQKKRKHSRRTRTQPKPWGACCELYCAGCGVGVKYDRVLTSYLERYHAECRRIKKTDLEQAVEEKIEACPNVVVRRYHQRIQDSLVEKIADGRMNLSDLDGLADMQPASNSPITPQLKLRGGGMGLTLRKKLRRSKSKKVTTPIQTPNAQDYENNELVEVSLPSPPELRLRGGGDHSDDEEEQSSDDDSYNSFDDMFPWYISSPNTDFNITVWKKGQTRPYVRNELKTIIDRHEKRGEEVPVEKKTSRISLECPSCFAKMKVTTKEYTVFEVKNEGPSTEFNSSSEPLFDLWSGQDDMEVDNDENQTPNLGLRGGKCYRRSPYPNGRSYRVKKVNLPSMPEYHSDDEEDEEDQGEEAIDEEEEEDAQEEDEYEEYDEEQHDEPEDYEERDAEDDEQEDEEQADDEQDDEEPEYEAQEDDKSNEEDNGVEDVDDQCGEGENDRSFDSTSSDSDSDKSFKSDSSGSDYTPSESSDSPDEEDEDQEEGLKPEPFIRRNPRKAAHLGLRGGSQLREDNVLLSASVRAELEKSFSPEAIEDFFDCGKYFPYVRFPVSSSSQTDPFINMTDTTFRSLIKDKPLSKMAKSSYWDEDKLYDLFALDDDELWMHLQVQVFHPSIDDSHDKAYALVGINPLPGWPIMQIVGYHDLQNKDGSVKPLDGVWEMLTKRSEHLRLVLRLAIDDIDQRYCDGIIPLEYNRRGEMKEGVDFLQFLQNCIESCSTEEHNDSKIETNNSKGNVSLSLRGGDYPELKHVRCKARETWTHDNLYFAPFHTDSSNSSDTSDSDSSSDSDSDSDPRNEIDALINSIYDQLEQSSNTTELEIQKLLQTATLTNAYFTYVRTPSFNSKFNTLGSKEIFPFTREEIVAIMKKYPLDSQDSWDCAAAYALTTMINDASQEDCELWEMVEVQLVQTDFAGLVAVVAVNFGELPVLEIVGYIPMEDEEDRGEEVEDEEFEADDNEDENNEYEKDGDEDDGHDEAEDEVDDEAEEHKSEDQDAGDEEDEYESEGDKSEDDIALVNDMVEKLKKAEVDIIRYIRTGQELIMKGSYNGIRSLMEGANPHKKMSFIEFLEGCIESKIVVVFPRS